MKWTDPRVVYVFLLMLFAFLVLGIIARLAYAIALGKVEELTSYGLHELLLILAMIATKVVDSLFNAAKVIVESIFGKENPPVTGGS